MSNVSAAILTRASADLRADLGALQVKLGTGKKALTYKEQGHFRNTALALREEISFGKGIERSQKLATTRMQLMQNALGRVQTITTDALTVAQGASHPLSPEARTSAFVGSGLRFGEMLSLLNERGTDGEYLFAGSWSGDPPVAKEREVLYGDGVRDGVIAVVNERRAADAGATGLGRLEVSASANTASVERDGAHPFGLQVASVTAHGNNITISAAPTAPDTKWDINFAGSVRLGAQVNLDLNLPDGTQRTITLEAADVVEPSAAQFKVGANAQETAQNFSTALTAQLENFVQTELRAASSFVAARQFFGLDNEGSVPQRVDGNPLTATSLRDATAADTVRWYTGDRSGNSDSAFIARLSNDQVVRYGIAANEEAFRESLAAFAVGALENLEPPPVSVEVDSQVAVGKRMHSALQFKDVRLSPNALIHKTGLNQTSVASAGEQLNAKQALLRELQAKVETADPAEIAVQLLRLQTLLQASYAAATNITRSSLVDYLR